MKSFFLALIVICLCSKNNQVVGEHIFRANWAFEPGAQEAIMIPYGTSLDLDKGQMHVYWRSHPRQPQKCSLAFDNIPYVDELL